MAKKSFLWANTHTATRDCGKVTLPVSISNSLADASPLLYLPQAQPALRAVIKPPASFALVSQPWKLYFFGPPLQLQKQVKSNPAVSLLSSLDVLPEGLSRHKRWLQACKTHTRSWRCMERRWPRTLACLGSGHPEAPGMHYPGNYSQILAEHHLSLSLVCEPHGYHWKGEREKC